MGQELHWPYYPRLAETMNKEIEWPLSDWMWQNGPYIKFGGNALIHKDFYRACWRYENRFGNPPPRKLWPVILQQVMKP